LHHQITKNFIVTSKKKSIKIFKRPYLVEPRLVPEPHPVELSGLVGVGESAGHDDGLVLGEHEPFNRIIVVLVNHIQL